MSNDKFATRVSLKRETVQEIEKAKQFIKQMEKDLGWSTEKSRYRLPNNQFDRDAIIREAVKQHFGDDA